MPRLRPSVVRVSVGVALLAALAAVAGLQYRWIAQLGDTERAALRSSLDAGAARFTADVDRLVGRAADAFETGGGLDEDRLESALAERLARWRATGEDGGIVRDVLVVTRRGPDDASLARFDERAGRLVPAVWDDSVASLRRIFEARGRVPQEDERLPGILVKVRPPREARDDAPRPRGPRPRDERRPGDAAPRPPEGERRPPRDHVVVRFDAAYLSDNLFPRLAARDFPSWSVTVSVVSDPARVLFRSGPAVSGPPDVARPFFGPRRAGDDEKAGRWLLEVRHPAGSLETAVAAARRRNLALSLAVLGVLAAALALLAAAARSAERLARQQMDFVAAVSHELRTPLTAMRSAGQNLADGIVDDPARIREYGALVEREGRRLTEMVGRVLAFAGVRSGRQVLRLRPVAVRPLVEAVVTDARLLLEEKRVAVEVDVPADLPPVRGDEAALRVALANLLDNAVKYGGASRPVAIRAALAHGPHGAEVVISVSDRGPGLRRSEVARAFEPFVRGEEAAAAGVPGTGIGLAVVRGVAEAHGGSVSVESTPGRGATFVLRLPADPAEAGA